MEAVCKATGLLTGMIKWVLTAGITADYILMDSWFSFPRVIPILSRELPLICMLKNMPKVSYKYKGKYYTLGRLYNGIRIRPGRTKNLARVIVETKPGQRVKIVFVRHRHKRD